MVFTTYLPYPYIEQLACPSPAHSEEYKVNKDIFLCYFDKITHTKNVFEITNAAISVDFLQFICSKEFL